MNAPLDQEKQSICVRIPCRMGKAIYNFIRENLGIIIALIVLCLFLALYPPTSKAFWSSRNLLTILRQVSTNLYIACGMTMVIILGGIDLSVGSVIALSGCLAAGGVVRYELSIPAAVLLGLCVGVSVGMFNGAVVAKTTIPAFIVTLATMNVARGLAQVYTGGSPVRVVNDTWQWLGGGFELGIPVPVWLLLFILVISAVLMNWTKFGRHVYAVGGNPQAAVFSGISVQRIKFLVHTFTGLMAGIAGVVMASRMYSGQPTAGMGAEMDAIAAVVVGGTSMQGGSGKIGGTVIGGLIIGVLNNGLNLMNVNSSWQYVFKGIIILLAVFIDFVRTSRKAR